MEDTVSWRGYKDTAGNFWIGVAAASCFKLLFLHSYRSTDFEVHRNWLAITHSSPLKDWYYEEKSEWTLDYPPFFAYFEWMLGWIAQYFDPEMLKIENLNYASESTVLFQKISVIASDLILAYGVLQCHGVLRHIVPNESLASINRIKMFGLIFINGGLFMVDQIHFQYNGFLFGVLLLSISKVVEGKCFQGALLFSVLLNLKHIFVYMAPAFGIFLFVKYCVSERRTMFYIRFGNFATLATIVITIFTISFGPFYQHTQQILIRLFPFKRGLCHAYWAPNFWAAYSSLDLILNFILKKGKSTLTGGLVGENRFTVLPSVLPIHSLAITVLLIMPSVYKIWKQPSEKHFIYGIISIAWTSFMFGYHVHEKAILNILIPFALISVLEPKIFIICLAAGSFSLFPLLFTSYEIIFKAIIFIFSLTLSMVIHPVKLNYIEILYLIGFLPLYCFENLLPVFWNKYPFLPLICVSDYCFLGIFYSYVRFYINFMKSEVSDKSTVTRTKTASGSFSKKLKSKAKNKAKSS